MSVKKVVYMQEIWERKQKCCWKYPTPEELHITREFLQLSVASTMAAIWLNGGFSIIWGNVIAQFATLETSFLPPILNLIWEDVKFFMKLIGWTKMEYMTFYSFYRDRINRVIDKLKIECEGKGIVEESIWNGIVIDLYGVFHNAAIRCLIAELHICKNKGRLSGFTASEEYESYGGENANP